MRSIRVPFTFHSRSIPVPIAFHFAFHCYRNASAERVPVTLVSKPDIIGNHRDFPRISQPHLHILCSHYKAHETAFLYLLSTNESQIKITYNEHITYMYVRGLWSILRNKTKHNLANFLYSPSGL
jgi:hypothetical protein